MLLLGGEGPGGRLISRAAFAAFVTPFVPAPDFGPTASYGYAIAVDTLEGDRVLRHTGGMVSFMSSIQINLDGGHAAFASINAQQGYRPNRVTRYALQLLRTDQQSRALPGPPVADGRRLTVRVQDPPTLMPYEGVFYSGDPWQGTARVVARRGRLWMNGNDFERIDVPTRSDATPARALLW